MLSNQFYNTEKKNTSFHTINLSELHFLCICVTNRKGIKTHFWQKKKINKKYVVFVT